MAADSKGNTGTADVTYNLVSILFHALQGAETYDQFVRDAEQSGDQELAQYFRMVKEEDERRADQAKQLLGKRLQQNQ
jgi:rubrerythrin